MEPFSRQAALDPEGLLVPDDGDRVPVGQLHVAVVAPQDRGAAEAAEAVRRHDGLHHVGDGELEGAGHAGAELCGHVLGHGNIAPLAFSM